MTLLLSLLSRNWNAELRLMTFKPANCDSALIRSSDKPSEKNCSSALPLSLANGNTATDLSGAEGSDGTGMPAAAAFDTKGPGMATTAGLAGARAYIHNA